MNACDAPTLSRYKHRRCPLGGCDACRELGRRAARRHRATRRRAMHAAAWCVFCDEPFPSATGAHVHETVIHGRSAA
jgi:hypothetical protein